jgi:hypothetical protein
MNGPTRIMQTKKLASTRAIPYGGFILALSGKNFSWQLRKTKSKCNGLTVLLRKPWKRDTLLPLGCQGRTDLGFSSKNEDMHLKCCIFRDGPKINRSYASTG